LGVVRPSRNDRSAGKTTAVVPWRSALHRIARVTDR